MADTHRITTVTIRFFPFVRTFGILFVNAKQERKI